MLETVNKIISQRYSFAIGRGRFDTPLPYADAVVGSCPRCGGEIVERDKNFGCVNWPQPHNCKFTIWKEPLQLKNYGVSIDTETAKNLLSGKVVQVSAAEEKIFYLKLDDSQKSEYGPRFVFETAENFASQNGNTANKAVKKKTKNKENKEAIPENNGQICL